MSACTHQLMLVQSELVQFSNELAACLIRTAVIFLSSFAVTCTDISLCSRTLS